MFHESAKPNIAGTGKQQFSFLFACSNLDRCLAVRSRFDTLVPQSNFISKNRGVLELKVKIYTKPGCPYCAKAREFYTQQGTPFEDLNAQDNLVYRKEMLTLTAGDPTVPVIVEDGKLKQIGWEGRG